MRILNLDETHVSALRKRGVYLQCGACPFKERLPWQLIDKNHALRVPYGKRGYTDHFPIHGERILFDTFQFFLYPERDLGRQEAGATHCATVLPEGISLFEQLINLDPRTSLELDFDVTR